MVKLIYADNAATTALDIKAFEAMKPYLLSEYANASQPYKFAKTTKKALKRAREIIADCINAYPEEIFFTSGGTESDNWAIKGLPFDDSDRKIIITSQFEHHAILNSCKYMEKMGYPVIYIQPAKDGQITNDKLKNVINNKTKLVSIMFANNEIGSIQPVKELCKTAHSNGSLFHTDAVQAIGHVEIDVKNLDIDLLSASAHKFNGPKGIGFLFIRKGLKINPYINGGSQERNYRAGTENVASIVAMAEALKINCDSLKQNQQHVKKLEDIFLHHLDNFQVPYVKNGGSNTLPGLISLSFLNKSGEVILHRMDLMGISISTGSACDSKNTKISHVLQAVNLDEKLAKGTIRISLGKCNTEDEVIKIAEALKILIRNA